MLIVHSILYILLFMFQRVRPRDHARHDKYQVKCRLKKGDKDVILAENQKVIPHD